MTPDIVERLREVVRPPGSPLPYGWEAYWATRLNALLGEAADEIESLRARLEAVDGDLHD